MRHHALPGHLLRAMASGMAGGELMPVLIGAEYSLRLVALRAVLDAVRQRAPSSPLDDVDVAWDLLVRAEEADPAVARTVLTYPYVGTWARVLLRRLRAPAAEAGTDGAAPDPAVPLWAEIGYLHSLAASAAALAGLTFRIRVPALAGGVVLPTLGLACAADTAEDRPAAATPVWVSGSPGRVVIDLDSVLVALPAQPGADADHWRPVRSVRLLERGVPLAVAVDDIDPYRMPGGRTPPAPLSAEQADRWSAQLAQAWALLVGTDTEAARTMSGLLSAISPLEAAERFGPRSASSADAFGSLLASAPEDAAQLAAVLVHEVQHGKLGAIMHLARLHSPASTRLYYAPWRDDPRPLAGLLQGVYAFAGVSWFWREHRTAASGPGRRLAEFEFALWRAQTTWTAAKLRGDPDLTALGARFVEQVGRWMRPWLAEAVPDDIRAAADLAAVEHRIGWRLHHLRPEASVVDQLADAYPDEPPVRWAASPAPAVAPAEQCGHLDSTAQLLRYRLVDPDAFAVFLSDPARAEAAVAGASRVHLLVAAGRYGDARRVCTARVAAVPGAREGWVGLALSLYGPRTAGGLDTAARASLLLAPELVRAVAARLADIGRPAVDPVRLAAWLGGRR